MICFLDCGLRVFDDVSGDFQRMYVFVFMHCTVTCNESASSHSSTVFVFECRRSLIASSCWIDKVIFSIHVWSVTPHSVRAQKLLRASARQQSSLSLSMGLYLRTQIVTYWPSSEVGMQETYVCTVFLDMISIRLVSAISVYNDGTLCMDIIQDQWSPCHSVSTLLTSVQVTILALWYTVVWSFWALMSVCCKHQSRGRNSASRTFSCRSFLSRRVNFVSCGVVYNWVWFFFVQSESNPKPTTQMLNTAYCFGPPFTEPVVWP